jgi:hypothetical protein
MPFNSREYEWADLSLILGGNDLTGIRAVKYSEKAEREALYAKGRYPHSIQTGNCSYDGEVTLLQSEYESLVTASNGNILGLSLDAEINCGNPPDESVTDRIIGLRFTETAKEYKQGDKFIEITLPFVALRVIPQV